MTGELTVGVPAAGPEPEWQSFLTCLLGRWHEGALPPPLPEWLPQEELERLAGRPEEQRGRFVALVRKRLTGFPFEELHPTWIAAHLPADRLLGSWSLQVLPPVVRRRVEALVRSQRGLSVAVDPPHWFGAWWSRYLRRLLPYPAPLPSRLDSPAALSYLWRLKEEEAFAFLNLYGLRLVAAALFRLEHREIVHLVYWLPAQLQPRLVALVREREFPAEEDWRSRLRALQGADCSPELVSVQLALVDIAAHSVKRGRRTDAVRFAYRLPMDIGSRLLSYLEADLSPLAAQDAAAFDSYMEQDLEVAVGSPRLAETETDQEVY